MLDHRDIKSTMVYLKFTDELKHKLQLYRVKVKIVKFEIKLWDLWKSFLVCFYWFGL